MTFQAFCKTDFGFSKLVNFKKDLLDLGHCCPTCFNLPSDFEKVRFRSSTILRTIRWQHPFIFTLSIFDRKYRSLPTWVIYGFIGKVTYVLIFQWHKDFLISKWTLHYSENKTNFVFFLFTEKIVRKFLLFSCAFLISLITVMSRSTHKESPWKHVPKRFIDLFWDYTWEFGYLDF